MTSFTPTAPFRPHRWEVGLLLSISLLIRIAVLLTQSSNLQADPDGYRRMAENVYHHGVLSDQEPQPESNAELHSSTESLIPTAYRPPLYPMLLSVAVASPLGLYPTIIVLHLTLGMLTIWLTVELAIQLGLGRAALLAGALVALDPILLHQSTLVMTETFATFFTALALWILVKLSTRIPSIDHSASELLTKKARLTFCAWAGASLAMAAVCRPTFLVFLIAVAITMGFLWENGRTKFAALAVYLLAAAVVLTPWIVRNSYLFGKPIMATTHGGYTFHLANNPGFYEFLQSADWGDVWRSDEPFMLYPGSLIQTSMTDYPNQRLNVASLSPTERELVLDKLHYADAWHAIQAEPDMFCWSILVRLGRFFQPIPHAVQRASDSKTNLLDNASHASESSAAETSAAKLMRYLVGGWYLALYLLALAGAWSLGRKLWQSPWGWSMLLVLCFLAVHAFYWTDMRMRAPVMPVIALGAAAGVGWLAMLARKQKSLEVHHLCEGK